jgi:anti-sigma B factor antagonist
MLFTTHSRDGVTVAELSGRLTVGDGAPVLRDQVKGLLARGVQSIVLDFAGLQMMDSSGLGELSAAKRSAQSAGGNVKLLNVSSELRRVLQVAGILGAFEIFDDEASAVASFRR